MRPLLLTLLIAAPACQARAGSQTFPLDPVPGIAARDCDLVGELADLNERWPMSEPSKPQASVPADAATSRAVVDAARDALACDHTTSTDATTWDAALRIQRAARDLQSQGHPDQAAEAGVVLLQIGARLRSNEAFGALLRSQIQPLGAERIRELAPALDPAQRTHLATSLEQARVPDMRAQILFIDAALYALREEKG